MPILPAETVKFPENLFENFCVETHTEETWWVLHTRPRQEKSLARDLIRHQLAFYLPQVARRSLIRGKVVTAHVPLFPSYLFLWASDKHRITALSTKRVVQALKVTAQESLWNELSQVHRLIAAGAPVTPEERLGPGSKVEICSGPLAGLRGIILRSASGRRFVVQVDFIQRGASVELDDFTLVRATE